MPLNITCGSGNWPIAIWPACSSYHSSDASSPFLIHPSSHSVLNTRVQLTRQLGHHFECLWVQFWRKEWIPEGGAEKLAWEQLLFKRTDSNPNFTASQCKHGYWITCNIINIFWYSCLATKSTMIKGMLMNDKNSTFSFKEQKRNSVLVSTLMWLTLNSRQQWKSLINILFFNPVCTNFLF